jgi:hypothetical protein
MKERLGAWLPLMPDTKVAITESERPTRRLT